MNDERQEHEVDRALHELAFINQCCFISDLRLLFRHGRLKRRGIALQGYDLGVWGKVFTYLSGYPVSFGGYEEVESTFAFSRSSFDSD